MKGNNIDILRCKLKRKPKTSNNKTQFINTSYGKIRLLDTGGNKPVIINAPDGPNVIEHQEDLIFKLSENFRVICFEFPGTGLSYPNPDYDYSIDNGAKLLLDIMDVLRIKRAAFSLSCSNGIYGIKAAELSSNKISHLFLSQTCSLDSLKRWSKKSIPKILTYPFIGQFANLILEKKLSKTWYKYALPKNTNKFEYEKIAIKILSNGGCFCLSSLVQSLSKEINNKLKVIDVPSTLIWGERDFTHRKTNNSSILQHLPNCKIIEFINCGHFPELENTTKYVQVINSRFV